MNESTHYLPSFRSQHPLSPTPNPSYNTGAANFILILLPLCGRRRVERGGGGWPGRIIKAAWKQYKTIKGSYHNRAVQPGTILYLAGKRGGEGEYTQPHTRADVQRWGKGGGKRVEEVSCLIYVIITWSPESKLWWPPPANLESAYMDCSTPFFCLSRSTLTSSVRILLFPCGYRSIFLRVDKLKKKRKEKKVRLSEKIEIG